MAAERQTRAIRKKLFRSVLRKEIAYFDVHKTGELNTKLTDDIDKIHDGIGDKLGSASQFIASFFTGIILGKFIYNYIYIYIGTGQSGRRPQLLYCTTTSIHYQKPMILLPVIVLIKC